MKSIRLFYPLVLFSTMTSPLLSAEPQPPAGFRAIFNGRDLTFGWDSTSVLLVLGAAYVGHIDDLAVFDRVLTDAEVQRIYGLQNGVSELYEPND